MISWLYVWWQLGCVSTQWSLFWTACPQVHDDLPQFENFAFSHKLPQPPSTPLLSLASHKSAQDILGLLNLHLHHEDEDEQWTLFTEQPPNRKDGLRLSCIKWSLSHCPGYEGQQGREISITILWGNRYGFFMMIILAFLIQTNSVSKYWSPILRWHEARRIVHVTLIISIWVFLAKKCVHHDIKIISWWTLTFQNWLYI